MSGMKMKKQIKWWGCCAAALLMVAACSEQKEKKAQNSSKAVIEKVTASATVAKIEKPEATPEAAKKQSIQKAEAATAKTDNGEGREYRINYRHRNKAVKLVDYFTDIHYVPLETNDASLLTNTLNRVICRNGFIYTSDFIAGEPTVLLFDNKGKFIRKIGRKGQGPEDHLGFVSMNVSPKGWVSMIDRFYMGVITYTTEGEFISRIRMDSVSVADAIYLNDSLLLVKSCHDQSGHLCHTLNMRSEQIINTSHPINKRMYRVWLNNGFTTYKGKILMSDYQSNEILELTANGTKVRYVLNINNKMPPKGFWEQKVKDYSEIMQEEAQRGYIGHIPAFTESDQSLFFRIRGTAGAKEKEGMVIVNKATRKYETFNHIALTDKFKIEPDFFYAQSDGQVIFILTAEEILNSGDNDFIARFPGLVEDSNPVLLFATLK